MYHRAQACEWDNYERDQEKLVDMARRGIRVPPFYLLSTPASASDQLICAQHWVKSIGPPREAVFDHKPIVGRERIRLGYLSGDFHQHATAQLMAELFERHDRGLLRGVSHIPTVQTIIARCGRALAPVSNRFVDMSARCHTARPRRLIHADQVDIWLI